MTQPSQEDPARVDVDTTSPSPENGVVPSAVLTAAKHSAAEHGLAVFPCREGEKLPATRHGCKDATTDPVVFETRFRPAHNLGVATGTVSGVFVVDIDGEEGEASLATLVARHGELPETATARTPRGGRHLYFRLPSGSEIRSSASKIASKIDIRGKGGYVVAPPSRLPNGVYAWADGLSLDQVGVADAPEWLNTLVTGDQPKRSEPLGDGQIPEGERNTTLASLAGGMRSRGFSKKAIEAALLVQNTATCSPPLPDSEVKSIARSIAKYDFDDRPARAPAFKPFPLEALPEPLGGFVANASGAIGCDPCYVALPLLTALGSAIGNTRRIRLKEGWSEPAILWSAIVGDSGTMKSPALEVALRAVKERQKQEWRSLDFARPDYEAAKLQYEKQLANWKNPKSNDQPPTPPDEPVAERTWADDLTTEALAMLLQQNPRGLLVACDELAGWLGGFDKYSQGGGDAARWL